jgi:Big-like domain-containing protein
VISGGPAQGSTTSSTTAAFTSFGAASDPDATFQCRLDPPGSIGSFAACPKNGATFSNLAQNGTWQLAVRAVDPSGNVDTTPAVRSWIVDTTPPVVGLTGGPAENSATNQTSATFNVSTSDGTLACTLDGAALSSCAPPTIILSSLGNGSHTFTVRGVDAVGNSSSPITRHWTVDTAPPLLTLSGGPAQGSSTNQNGATFTIGTNEGTLSCALDGVATSCAPPSKGLSGLADGSHTFGISATDTAGNSSSASRTWTVDTVPPALTLSGGPAEGSVSDMTTATFTIATTEGALSCKLDGMAVPCAPPSATVSGLADGVHTFTIAASDAAGNAANASRTWTVTLPAGTGGDTGGSLPGTAPGSAGTGAASVPPRKRCRKDRKLRHGKCRKKRRDHHR